jgi:hypothetical protein
MPERSNGAVSKTVVRVSGPRVRIPVSPLNINEVYRKTTTLEWFFRNTASMVLKFPAIY